MHLVKYFLPPWKSSVTLISCSTWHFHFSFWPDIHNKIWHSETSAFYANLLQSSILKPLKLNTPFLSHITSSPGTVQSLLSNPIRLLTFIFKKLIKMYRCLNPIQGSQLPSCGEGERVAGVGVGVGETGGWVMGLAGPLRSGFVPSPIARPSFLGSRWSIFGTCVSFAVRSGGLWDYCTDFYVAWSTLIHLSGKWLNVMEEGSDLQEMVGLIAGKYNKVFYQVVRGSGRGAFPRKGEWREGVPEDLSSPGTFPIFWF